MGKKNKRKKPLSRGKKAVLIIILSAAAVFAVFCTYVHVHFADHTALNTTIDGIDVSNQTASQVKKVIQKEADQMVLTIAGGDQTVEADASVLGVTTDIQKETERALQTGKNKNPFDVVFGEHKLKLQSSYDEKVSDDYVNANFAAMITAPVDAQVSFDANTNTYAVTAGSCGKVIDTEPLHEAVEKMIADPSSASLTLQQVDDAEPTVTDAEAQATADSLNAIVANGIAVTSGGQTLYTIQPSDIAGWVNISLNSDTGTYDYTFNTDAITSFVADTIDPQIEVPAVDKAVIKDSSGNVMKVLSEGQNGIEPAETADTTAADLIALLQSGQGGSLDIATTSKACGSSSITASDGRYIEYNRSTYTVTLWDGNNVVWQTDQTADGKPSTPTITGLYSVIRKTYVTSMPNPPSPEPLENIHYVTYWEPRGYAFHEAWWLTSYKIHTGISHGCINMWIDDAKTVYDFAVVGMPVWVHD